MIAGMNMSQVFEAFDLAGLEVEKCGNTWRVKDWDDEKADRLDRIVHGVYGMRMVDSERARVMTRESGGREWVGRMGKSETIDDWDGIDGDGYVDDTRADVVDETVIEMNWADTVKKADGIAKGLADKVRTRLDRGNDGGR
jgi:hypothetical protein